MRLNKKLLFRKLVDVAAAKIVEWGVKRILGWKEIPPPERFPPGAVVFEAPLDQLRDNQSN